MIGEIRDPETAQLALRAALSGILVFSTLHTQDSAGAVPRLMDMGLEPYLLASGIVGVIAQRLMRMICPDCREQVVYPAEVLAKVGLTPDPGLVFYRGRGCTQVRRHRLSRPHRRDGNPGRRPHHPHAHPRARRFAADQAGRRRAPA